MMVFGGELMPFLPPVRERKGINGKKDESDDDAESEADGKSVKVYKKMLYVIPS
jgi:hypothetical protein